MASTERLKYSKTLSCRIIRDTAGIPDTWCIPCHSEYSTMYTGPGRNYPNDVRRTGYILILSADLGMTLMCYKDYPALGNRSAFYPYSSVGKTFTFIWRHPGRWFELTSSISFYRSACAYVPKNTYPCRRPGNNRVQGASHRNRMPQRRISVVGVWKIVLDVPTGQPTVAKPVLIVKYLYLLGYKFGGKKE